MINAGFARIDITPPLGNELAGYFFTRLAKGILDPLYTNAVAIGNDSEKIVLLTVDCLGIAMSGATKIRKLVSECTNIPVDHVLLAALHQHTSIRIAEKSKEDKENFGSFDDATALNVISRKIADCAIMAINDMKPATVSTGEKELDEPISFVRRYFTNEGVRTNPPRELQLLGRCAEADNTVRLIKLTREGGNDIAIVNFSTHPDTVAGDLYSADWPGFVRTFTEKKLAGVNAICFTGFQGDTNHLDFYLSREEWAKIYGYKYTQHMGEVIADAVFNIWNQTKASNGDNVFAVEDVIFTRTRLEGIDELDKWVKWFDDFHNGKLDYDPNLNELGPARRITALLKQPIFRPLPIMVVGFADVLWVGLGGEPFTDYRRKIEPLTGGKYLVCSTCTNAYQGYLPTAEAFAQGGYETDGTHFTPELETNILTSVEKLIKSVK